MQAAVALPSVGASGGAPVARVWRARESRAREARRQQREQWSARERARQEREWAEMLREWEAVGDGDEWIGSPEDFRQARRARAIPGAVLAAFDRLADQIMSLYGCHADAMHEDANRHLGRLAIETEALRGLVTEALADARERHHTEG